MSKLNKFIEDELKLRKRHYAEDPASIIEHYNIEQQNIQTYNGRQLLEMLQNADDACETAIEKKVLIRLNEHELSISNNGEHFTEGGFLSITRSNLSPKTMQQNKIGQKGLGFRSILSWADEIVINSGETRLGFSQAIAQSFLKNLIKEDSSILTSLKKRTKVPLPIATLRVPQLLNGIQEEQNNFDTSIVLKLKEGVGNDVQSQITSLLNKETLIFLNHIEEIEIDSPERKVVYKKRIKADTVTVTCRDFVSDSLESKTWYLNKKTGVHNSKNYELAVAWSDKLDDNENVLFSNFKTQVQFPFPALLHGTFELTQNRNQLENDTTGHNEFLTEKLAELLIDTSIKITSQSQQSNYHPLRLLNIDFSKIDTVLMNFKFKEKLTEKIKASAVFPTVNGKYINYASKPVFYDFPIATFLKGEDVKHLLLSNTEEEFLKFLKSFSLYHYSFDYFFKIVSGRTADIATLAKLIFLALTYNVYKQQINSDEFHLLDLPEFLVDNDGHAIQWSSKIFLQPGGGKEFVLPNSFSIQFVATELVNALLKEFNTGNIDALLNILEPLHVKKYSFTDISETLIQHYNDKGKLKPGDARELHTYLFRLYQNEAKPSVPSRLASDISIPVISDNSRVKSAGEVYFGKSYGSVLSHKLYSFDKSKLLADRKYFGLEKFDASAVREYFAWLGVAELPRCFLKNITTNKNDPYVEFVLRNFKYPTSKWGWNFKTFNELKNWLPWEIKLKVGEYDEIDRILSHAKIEDIFEWIKRDPHLRETLENDREVFSGTQFYCYKNTDRTLHKQDLRSYTKWKISTTIFLPIQVGKAAPEKCCLSKTITAEFSPFVEKPQINTSIIAEKLVLSEDVIESYLTLLGVHREISSFSIEVLYNMLFSLTSSDKTGKVARSIYREVINNFNENRLDITHPVYQRFLSTGKVLCTKGNETAYFAVSEAYYIETKSFGNNILKRFPLVCMDRKRGNKKVERLFGVKPLENIDFKITGEPKIHPLNLQFNDEIHRFKALVYALRMHQDTRHEIKNRLKRLKIILVKDIKAEFIHNQSAQKFELEQYEFIVTKNKSIFHILVPEIELSPDDLKQNISFCDSVAEIFTTLINTEEYRGFIHDLFSRREFDREPRLLSELQQDNNDLIVQAKNQLEIIDDIRLSFWNAFSIASAKGIKTDIRNEKELNSFLLRKLKLNESKLKRITSFDTFTQFADLENLEFIYRLFLEFKIDVIKFSRHFSGIDFSALFKNTIEDLKRKFRNDFSLQIYNKLKAESIKDKGAYFDHLDGYDYITYSPEEGYLTNIQTHFANSVYSQFQVNIQNPESTFSFQQLINKSIESLSEEGIVIPSGIKETRRTQALLVFNEVEEIKKEIIAFNSIPPRASGNQIKVGGATIEYHDFRSLAQQVLDGLDIGNIKLKFSKTLPVEERKNTGRKKAKRDKKRNVTFNPKNEEQIGFIAELICFHKLCEKYGERNINWVSENAYRAYPEKFITGEAGKGYDLELKEENGKIRFIEIKGSVSVEDGIRMTKEEIKTALEFPDKYDLLIVENPLSSDPIFRYIKNPFKFRSDETLFSNRKLKVFNDNYVIRFTWDE